MEVETIQNVASKSSSKLISSRNRRRNRYRSDFNFRAKCISESIRRIKEKSNNPIYKRIVQLRKDIWWQRERISRWSIKLESAEGKLLSLLKEKKELENSLETERLAVEKGRGR